MLSAEADYKTHTLSNSATMAFSGAGVTRETTTMKIEETTKAGRSS